METRFRFPIPFSQGRRLALAFLVALSVCATQEAWAQPARLASPAESQDDRVALPASPSAFLVPSPLLRGHAFGGTETEICRREHALRLHVGVPAATGAARPGAQSQRDKPARSARGPVGNARFPSWNLPPTAQGQGLFYANVAYAEFANEFDKDGERRPTGRDVAFSSPLQQAVALIGGLDPSAVPPGTVVAPARLEGQVKVVNLNIGGAFDVYSTPFYSVALGADFQASQQNFETDVLNINLAEGVGSIPLLGIANTPLADLVELLAPNAPALPESVELGPEESENIPETVESGFQAQALTLFAQAKSHLFSLRGGFQFDLGKAPDVLAGEREVSDRQNAILLGFTANYPFSERFRAYGGVDGWFTLEDEEDEITYDEGNSYAAQVGADVNVIPSLALGAALTYRYRTEGSFDIEGAEGAAPEGEEAGYNLGIGPYVNFNPPSLPLTLYLKGAVRDEYRDFSFSLIGENELAPRAGVTLGAVYHL